MIEVDRDDVVSRFLEMARRRGDAAAIIRGPDIATFRHLAEDVEILSGGLREAGLKAGDRAAVLTPPGRDFFASTFALFRMGAVPVLIDPGIGFVNMGRCLDEVQPAAFLGSPKAQVARLMGRWAGTSRLNLVTEGRFPGVRPLRGLRVPAQSYDAPVLNADARAAILFTSGSTGAPKGAVYTHGMFSSQVELLRRIFGIREGETSVATFPLFALFDVAMGMTTVIPDMDFTRPGFVDPMRIVGPLQHHRACQLFGSPALIDRVGRFGAHHGVALPDLRRVMSAGAPVPAKSLERFLSMLTPGTEIFTPYGATEALPVALIGSREILAETAAKTARGAGVCVGRPIDGVDVAVIGIDSNPIPRWSQAQVQPVGRIGEIVVKGPNVSPEYYRRADATAEAKIPDGTSARHRMGDLGYFDEHGRLWFCGRKSHRVKTEHGELYTIPVEGIFNAHPLVKRTALVGAKGIPVLCVELEPGADPPTVKAELLAMGAAHETTRSVKTILFHAGFPVDIRHNAKIFREKLAAWAEEILS